MRTLRFILLSLVSAGLFAQVDIRLRDRSPYLVLGRNLAWGQSGYGGIENNYMFTPLNPDQGICVFVTNNNPTSSHALTIESWQTGDPGVTSYTGNTGRFVQDTVQGTYSPVPAGSTLSAYVHTSAGAVVTLKVRGTSAQSGSPDTADLYLVQTSSGSCGPVQGGQQTVMGAQPEGQINTSNPIVVGGISYQNYIRSLALNPQGLVAVSGCSTSTNYAYTVLQSVPTSSTSLGTHPCLSKLSLSNSTTGTINVTVTDGGGTNCILCSFPLAANSTAILDTTGLYFTGGVKWFASATGVYGSAWFR
jgi:hypothetical protein